MVESIYYLSIPRMDTDRIAPDLLTPLRICVRAWLVAFIVSAGPGARASEVDDTHRWSPALSVSFDVVGQKARGSIHSGAVLGPPLPQGCDGRGGQLCPY